MGNDINLMESDLSALLGQQARSSPAPLYFTGELSMNELKIT